jgi:hypothetical protein
MMKRNLLAVSIACTLCGLAAGQETNPTTTDQWPQIQQKPQAEMLNGVPLYRIQVVGRDIPAINYFHRSGKTEIGLAGTSLLPETRKALPSSRAAVDAQSSTRNSKA